MNKWQPLTCSVYFNKELRKSEQLANKQIPHSSAIYFNSTISLFPSNMEMDVSVDSILRERSDLISKSNSRSFLVSSSASSIPYHKYMEVDNNKPNNNSRKPINSSQLSYMNNLNRDKPVSKMADNSPVDRSQYVSNKTLALISSPPT